MPLYPPQSQRGFALIGVMLFLILITIVGVVAARRGMTDLRVSTNDQVNAVLLNASDGVLSHLEVAATPSNPQYAETVLNFNGVLGYFLAPVTRGNIGDQLFFCYKPKSGNLFNLSQASIRTLDGNARLVGGATNLGGICNPDEADHYGSGRNVAMTQVAIRSLAGTEALSSEPFSGVIVGSDLGSTDSQIRTSPKLEIYATSILPALSDAKTENIRQCLNMPVAQAENYKAQGVQPQSAQATQNMMQCLRTHGVPVTGLVQQAQLAQDVESTHCMDVGNQGDLTQECRVILQGAGIDGLPS